MVFSLSILSRSFGNAVYFYLTGHLNYCLHYRAQLAQILQGAPKK